MATTLTETSRARESEPSQSERSEKVRFQVRLSKPKTIALDRMASEIGVSRNGLISIACNRLLSEHDKQTTG